MTMSSRHILAAAAILAAAIAASVLLQDLERAVVFTAIDDGPYYQIVAENLVRTGRLTYDGVSITNGFQPLFMAMMVPIYWLTGDPWTALKLVYCLIAVLSVVSCLLFGGISKRLGLTLSGFSIGFLILFANLRSFTLLFSLLETPLLLLACLAYLAYALRVGEKRYTQAREAFVCGLLIGLAFLARTDSSLLAAGYGVILLHRTARGRQKIRASARAGAAAAAGSLLLAGPYLLANALAFGHLVPVSGYRKMSVVTDWRILFQPLASVYDYLIPRLALVLGLPEKYHTALLFVILACLAAGCGILLTTTVRKRMGELFALLSDFFVFAALHFVVIYLFATEQVLVAAWYHVSELVAIALMVAFMMPRAKAFDRATVGLVAAALVAQSLLYPGFVERKTMTWAKLEAATYIREKLPQDARLAMVDSGITAYFGRRHFVGLNGVIGDYAMADLIKAGRWREVAERCGIEYLVLDVDPGLAGDLPGEEVFRGSVGTRYADFAEGEKVFFIFRVDPADLETIWRMRFG
ncbi:hypothetical protein ACFL4G_09825 [Thermodesulfobacteriota bacterium]